jgi:hypothetical protein
MLNQTPKHHLYDRARILAHLDKTEEMFPLLNQAYESEKRSRLLNKDLPLVFDEVWDPFRHDPRFRKLLEKIGFTKVNPKLRE